jgi:hypothetical protein
VEGATDPAVWSHAGTPPVAIRGVLSRDPHKGCQPQALVSTKLAHTEVQILTWCVRRWPLAVTCAAARAPLGMETQRPWQARAMARPTPALLSLYASITLTAQLLIATGATGVRSTAWYRKTRPTFADAMAVVRRQLWEHLHFATALQTTDRIKIPRVLVERFMDAVCYAT